MLATIWSSPNSAETLFLIAAIAFFIEAVLILVSPYIGSRTAADGTTRGYVAGRFTGFCAAVGLTLVALGLLAL
jgi:hypothetical protein